MNNKKEDEIYCAECGKPIKRRAIICPHCGVQIKELKTSPTTTPTTTIEVKPVSSPKNKVIAVLLAVFFGFWSWAYTYGRNAKYFWIGFGISFVLGILFIPSIITTITVDPGVEGIPIQGLLVFYFVLFGLWVLGSWLWALIDNAVKPSSFFINYPNI